MSTKRLSPAAKLLRNSRLFAIPAPLPRSGNESINQTGPKRMSDSATSQHPFQQAIATPPTSQARGDWGLKRPLPLRSTTRTSTPTLRINALDTIEHITDFESAGDVAITVEKFRDLNIAITADGAASRAARARDATSTPKSVFESHLDNTNPTLAQGPSAAKRWKFSGPWLASMNEGEFEKYAVKELSERSSEFTDFVRQDFKVTRLVELQRQDREQGIDPRQSYEYSEEEFQTYFHNLRREYAPDQKLGRLIKAFLDLPRAAIGDSPTDKFFAANAGEFIPPATHPSAGLGYLRSDAVIYNHPVLGPQSRKPPVESRILSSSYDQNTRSRRGLVGVGGVVTSLPDSIGTNRRMVQKFTAEEREKMSWPERADRNGNKIGVTMEGGTRVWMEPLRASIDASGRIGLEAQDAHEVSIGVKTGQVLDQPTVTSLLADAKAKSPVRPLADLAGDDRYGELGMRLDSKNGGGKAGLASAAGHSDDDLGMRAVQSLFDQLPMSGKK